MTRRTLLFDLDGTLTDPGKGIIGSVQHALREAGAEVPPYEELGWVIGPPLRVSFARLLGEGGDVEAAVSAYRSAYQSGGIFEATIYAGMPEVLEGLKARGFALHVCTAKPRVFATQVIEKFGYAPVFESIHGAELDGRFDDKGALIAHMIETIGFAPERTVMIGDRANDTTAAARNGIASVGVLWGYGDAQELTEGGAAALCQAPAELPALIDQILAEAPG